MNRIDDKIIAKMRRSLKLSGEITVYDQLKIRLLENAISDYNKAVENIEQNGLIITTNRGATTAQNPAVKIKLDNSKLIIRLVTDLMDKDNEEAEEFLSFMTT